MEITEVRIKLMGKKPGGQSPEAGKGPQPGDEPEPLSVAWLESRRPRLQSMLLGMGFNREDSNDAAQDAIIKAFTWVAAGRAAEIRNPDFWLRTVAVRAAQTLDRKRKRRRECSLAEGPVILPCRELEREEEEQFLLDAAYSVIERLPAELRTAFNRHHIEGRSIRQTARDLGIGLGAARGRLFRALQLIRKELEEYIYDVPESA